MKKLLFIFLASLSIQSLSFVETGGYVTIPVVATVAAGVLRAIIRCENQQNAQVIQAPPPNIIVAPNHNLDHEGHMSDSDSDNSDNNTVLTIRDLAYHAVPL